MSNANYNRIVIIQSLSEGLTGTRLLDDLNIKTIMTNGIVSSELIDVERKADFMETLSNIYHTVNDGSYIPIIQIEAHGSKDKSGLVMSSGELVPWQEMKEPLAQINKATRFDLIVCLSACHGANLAKVIDTFGRAPFWAIVGPKNEMKAGDLLKDFTRFYEELFKTQNGAAAFNQLNNSIIGSIAPYVFMPADWYFESLWLDFICYDYNNDNLNNRANDIIKKLKKRGDKKIPSRNQIKTDLLRSLQEYFIQSKEEFFMMDLFPENVDRFPVDYEIIHKKAKEAQIMTS
jgi:hypothetical protein